MVKNYSFHKRIFLNLLEDNEENTIIKSILKSPLGLSKELVRLLFENKLIELKNELDKIKYFVGGISSAETIANETHYSLARYYPNMFAFHQFFNSSYRARQGKVLEKILIYILTKYTECDLVPATSKEMLQIISMLFDHQFPKLDIDALGCDTKNKKTILIQLRSRDDTGGTTAKGSLVDLLRDMLRTKNSPTHDILYLISIWDARDSQQKKSTINKIYSSIKPLINFNKDVLENYITTKGVKVRNNLTLRLVYGIQEISKAIYDWNINKENEILKSISYTISLLENWDDMWVAYSVANLELEMISLYGYSNISLLDKKYNKTKNKIIFGTYEEIVKSIDNLALELIVNWTEDTIPLESPSDKVHYIRDLLFLRACYEKNK